MLKNNFKPAFFKYAANGFFIFLFISIFCYGNGYSSEAELRADLINLGTFIDADELERDPVIFMHDKHTDALAKMDGTCQTCHPADVNGKLSLKFKRHENPDTETLLIAKFLADDILGTASPAFQYKKVLFSLHHIDDGSFHIFHFLQ